MYSLLAAAMTYKLLEHTADIRMVVQGDSLESLFSEAVYGMMKILEPETDEQKGQFTERVITIEATDTTALLIDFLNEVLLSANLHKETYNEINFKSLSQHSLEAILHGVAVRSFGDDIKAVTYHEAEVKRNEDGTWETMIIFDI